MNVTEICYNTLDLFKIISAYHIKLIKHTNSLANNSAFKPTWRNPQNAQEKMEMINLHYL